MWTLGQSFPIAVAVTAQIQGRCTPERMREAIGAVRQRHPMLSVRVVAGRLVDGPGPSFRVATGDWAEVVQDELDDWFDAATGPLTRFVMLETESGFDLVMTSHHIVSDGLGMAYVLRDVLAHLADPFLARTVVEAPTLDALVRAMPKPKRLEPVRQPKSAWPVQPRPTERFALVTAALSEAESELLQDRCRAEQTTVHAALSLAGLRVLAGLDGIRNRQLYSPVNLRPLLPALPEGAVGQYNAEFFTWVDLEAEPDFWPAARRFRETLREQTRPDRLLRAMRLLRLSNLLPNAAMRSLLRVSCKPESSLTLTNLGRLPFPSRYGEFQITAVYPAVNMGTLTNGLLAAAAVDGRIFLGMSTRESGRPLAEQLVKGTISQVQDAIHH
jgi:hypothetical protein